MPDKVSSATTPKAGSFSGFFKTFGLGNEKESFLENFSLMLGSGMPVAEALHGIRKGMASKKFAKIIEELENDIHNGQHFWQAFAKTGLFSDYVISLIQIGEESGRLSQNLESLSRQQEKDLILRQRVQSAMIYPLIVFILTGILGIGIAWFLLPRLATVFLNLNLKIPLLTRMLIAFGGFLSQWGWLVIPAAVIFTIFVLYFLFSFPKTKFLGQKLLFSLPGVKTLIQQVEVSRFGYILGSLLQSGVPMVEAVRLLSQASIYYNYRKFFCFLKDSVEEGNSFQKSFELYKNVNRLLPVAVQQIIISGEQSGKLEHTFLAFGKSYEEKSEMTSKNLTVILEPLLLLVVWGGVAVVALAVIMPLYNLIGGLQGSSQPTTKSAAPAVYIPKKPAPSIIIEEDTLPATSTASSTVPVFPAIRGAATRSNLRVAPDIIKYLNVRKGPGPQEEAVAKVYPGEIYEINDYAHGWYLITVKPGVAGWVSADFVVLENN